MLPTTFYGNLKNPLNIVGNHLQDVLQQIAGEVLLVEEIRRSPVDMINIPLFTGFDTWVFPKIGVPQNGWFIMENPI